MNKEQKKEQEEISKQILRNFLKHINNPKCLHHTEDNTFEQFIRETTKETIINNRKLIISCKIIRCKSCLEVIRVIYPYEVMI